MKEYVDVEVLKQQDFQDFSNTDVMHAINHCPRADVEPVRHGHWVYIGKDKTDSIFACSECGRCIKNRSYESMLVVKVRFPYCHCGAKMDGKEEDEEIKNV